MGQCSRYQPLGGAGRQQGVPGGDGADGGEKFGRVGVLDDEAGRALPQRLQEVVVGVVGGQDEHLEVGEGTASEVMARVASMPSRSGILMSMTTRSAGVVRARSTACWPGGRLTGHLHVGGRADEHGERAADQVLVIGEQDADHRGPSLRGIGRGRGIRRSRRGSAASVAADAAGSFGHADEAEPGSSAGVARRPRPSSVMRSSTSGRTRGR